MTCFLTFVTTLCIFQRQTIHSMTIEIFPYRRTSASHIIHPLQHLIPVVFVKPIARVQHSRPKNSDTFCWLSVSSSPPCLLSKIYYTACVAMVNNQTHSSMINPCTQSGCGYNAPESSFLPTLVSHFS